MKKSKVLSVVMSSALVASLAATAALSVSAAGITNIDQIKDHSVGVTGSFNGWGEDVPLTDADGDGVYEGVIDIAEVTDEMITDAKTDKGPAVGKVSRGFSGVTFKVRLDGSWDDSWGDYEEAYDRTYNSQTDCAVEATAGGPLKIKVTFDTTKVSPDAFANPETFAEEGVPEIAYLPVSYEVVKEEAPVESSVEESSQEESSAAATESSVESSTAATESSVTSVASQAPATETSTDTTTVPTGDTTSAVALVAVVIASLGTAVVMTKKASKD